MTLRGPDLVGERCHEARLAHAGVAANEHSAPAVGSAGCDLRPGATEPLELALPLDQWGRPCPLDGHGALADHPERTRSARPRL